MPHDAPKIEESTKFNFFTSIWIVPLIALVIAGWLGYQYYDQRGPEIQIIFEKNEGLVAGQSQIKYRNVPVGLITKVELEKEGDGVVISARMEKSALPFLNEHAKFWIVKPEFGLTGVTGLDTLISGTYVQMYSKKGGKEFKKRFHGLDYAYREDEGGAYFVLQTEKGNSSVRKGTPVYLQNIKVGQVEYVTLGFDKISVDVIVYIDKIYVPYVHTDSKFWVRNILSATVNNGSLDVNVAPVVDMIQGAIEFSSSGFDPHNKVSDLHLFKLYASKNEITKHRIGHGKKHLEHFVLRTEHSVANLRIGAPVRYEGFGIGQVTGIDLKFNPKTHTMDGRVEVEIDTSAFSTGEDLNDTGHRAFRQAVREGMRAHIELLNPITGNLFVDLRFDENVTSAGIVEEKGVAYLPTVEEPQGDIAKSIGAFLAKLNALPLDELVRSMQKVVASSAEPVENANEVIKELKKSVENLNELTSKASFKRAPDELERALKELTRTLKAAKKTIKGYGSDALLMRQISDTLRSVKGSSEEMRHFLRMLNRKPNSLIFGDK